VTLGPRRHRLPWLLAGVELTLLLDFMVLMPLGPELMRALSLSPARFGALVSAYTLASASIGLLASTALERFRLRSWLLWLYAGFIAATLACAAATGATWLLAARIAAGACAGLASSVSMALLVNATPEARRGSAVGLVMTAYSVSAVAGVPLGLWLSNLWGWRAPFLAIGALAIPLWCSLQAWLEPAGTQPLPEIPEQAAPLLRSERILGWSLTFLVVAAGFLLIPYLGAFMIQNLGVRPRDLALVYFAGGAASFFWSRFVGSLVDRLGPARVLAVLLVATLLPHLGFPRLPPGSLALTIVTFVVFMTLTSSRMIPTLVLVSSRVPPAARGRYLAVNSSVSEAASGLAAWGGGALLTTSSVGTLDGLGRLSWIAVCVSGAALLVLGEIARRRRESASAGGGQRESVGEAA
jgi:DHA1 family inner membrane transport protein